MKKTLLCILLMLLCQMVASPACAEKDMVDEWYIVMLSAAERGTLVRAEDGFAFEDLPYTVMINDDDDDGGVVILNEDGGLVFLGGFYCDERDFAICLQEPDGTTGQKPVVLYLEGTDAGRWNTYMDNADTAFFTPTHILADGKRIEYYCVNGRLFLITGNDYGKLHLRWISDDAVLGTDENGVAELLFIRTTLQRIK